MNEETKGPEPPASEKPPLREEELAQILEAHRKWVESKEKEGKRADLRRANLQGAKLYGANLQEADLSRANLQGAILFDARLRGTNLRYARGLTQEQLDSACGDAETKLPPGMKIRTCTEEPPEARD